MAKVILEPLGDSRETFLPGEAWVNQLKGNQKLNHALREKRAAVRAG